MELDNFFAIIFRLGVMVIVYYLLFQKFYREYKKSKEIGYKNTYFLGFTVLFLILFVFHVFYGIYELYIHSVENYFELKAQFSWYENRDDLIGNIVNNQMRPAFLGFYFLINCVLATQIYPLEKANNWDKNPVMKLIIICGSSVWLLFIPAIGTSPFAIIPVFLAFIGIGIGFLLNILIFIKLYTNATGDLKKRALYGIFAFLFLAIGLILGMEVGWITSISDQLSYRWEVVIGSIIQIIGAIFYYKGFIQIHKTEMIERQQIKQEKLRLLKIFKGYFSKTDLLDYLIIFTVIVFLLLGLAWLTYPLENQYSIMRDTISFLGSSDTHNNPEGWWLFSIAFLVFGIMLLPIALYRFRKMNLVKRPLAIISLLFYVIASIGLILIAIFPDNRGESYFSGLSASRLHYSVAILTFGGFGLAFLMDFIIFVYDWRTTKLINPTSWILTYIIFFTVVILGIYTQITRDIICESNCWPGEGIYSFPLWEWIFLIVVFFVLYSIVLSLPDDLGNTKKS